VTGAKAAANTIYPMIHRWGNDYLLKAEFSGSLAKGTGVNIATDADVFLSMIDAWDMPLNDAQRDMYIEWSGSDPVTQAEKEINRKVCEVQRNSNNFVEVLVFDPNSNKCESIN